MTIADQDTHHDPDEDIRNEGAGAEADDLAVICAQTFESLQILRNLLSLMMPKEDDGAPKLEDLIAALVAQQRDILVGIKQLNSNMNALFDRLDGKFGTDKQHSIPG